MTEETTTATLLLDIYGQMSELNRTVGGLQSSVVALTTATDRADDLAISDRQTIHHNIEGLRDELRQIEERLAVGTERHRDFAKSLDRIDGRAIVIEEELKKVPALVEKVEDMHPKVKDLVEFKGRMAAIILVASTVTGAAFALIWEGIRYMMPDLHKLFEHFH